MCSYNAVNGIPSCANAKFQNDIVRGEWGWDGYIVSDCGAVANLFTQHNFTVRCSDALSVLMAFVRFCGTSNHTAMQHNWVDTVKAALQGGTDLECDNVFVSHALEALEKGAITIDDIDQALIRRLKYFVALGELDGPETVLYQTYGAEMVDSREHRLLSLTVAEQSMTLLKNDPVATDRSVASRAEPVLPLNPKAKIALIGPQANFTLEMLSNYEGQNALVLNYSPLMQMHAAGLDVTYAPGHSANVRNTNTSLIAAAVAAAKAADVAVVMIGLCADHCFGNGRTENEGDDRGPGGSGAPDLGFPGAQQQLLEAVLAVQV